jgi:phenylpropionate dioxygenase-like ring-hydroxylating dioxygenase large terminal subunit
MYINFWYAADWSHRLADKPLKKRMLGQDLVLYRDASGKAHCLANVCVHRGGSLAGGRLKGDRIECPYHGWQYDAGGQCRKIPSLGPQGQGRIPARARVDSYPTEERYGLVFVFLGDLPEAERPPIMEIPEFGQPGWYAHCEDRISEGDLQRQIENGLDPAHNEYVHPTHGFSGEREEYFVPDLKVDERPWGTGFITTYFAPPLKDEAMQKASGRSENAVIEAGTFHHGPSCMITYIHPTGQHFIHQNVFKTPIDEMHQHSFLVQTRNFLVGAEHDQRFADRNKVVRDQDIVVLGDIEPKLPPESNAHELLMPADMAVARYREKLREWEGRGWRIDVAEIRRTSERMTYVIPSPARRTDPKGWVLAPVPLLPAHKGAAREARAAG